MSDGLPAEVQAELDRAVARLTASLGENLYSCVLYGSAARGDFVPGVSDLNLLIVLKEPTPDAHAAIADALHGADGAARLEPMVMGRPGLERSELAFAVKFRSIRRNYKVLSGADPLGEFSPDPGMVRFLCEQSLRNLRLRLTRAFVMWGRDRKRYTRYLLETLPAIIVDLSEAARSGGIDIPRDHPSRLPILEKTFAADVSVLGDGLRLRADAHDLSPEEARAYHARLYRLLSAAVSWMEARWPALIPQRPSN